MCALGGWDWFGEATVCQNWSQLEQRCIGRTQLGNSRWFLTVAFTFFEEGRGGKLLYSILISGCILLDIAIQPCWPAYACGFPGAHTPSWQAVADGWWLSPAVCAGWVLRNGGSRSGFSTDSPTLGIPGNPLMNLLLVQTSLGGESRKNAIVFLSLLSYGSLSVLWICKKTSFKASLTFWMKKKTLWIFKRLNVLWSKQKI